MTPGRLLVVVSLVAIAGCGSDGAAVSAGKGRVAIVMSTAGGSLVSPAALAGLEASAPANCTSPPTCQPEKVLQFARVYLSSILARTIDGKLIDVEMDLSAPVDLLSLVSGKEAILPKGSLPPGTYDQVVVVMKTVELTLQSGMKVAISPPGGGWTAIVAVTEPFTVQEGATTTISLDFRMDLSFACAVAGWDFNPKLDCKHTHNDKDKD